MKLRIIKPGLLTTVQDGGRAGYMDLGVSTSGAMDWRSYELANVLAGGKQGAPVLEITAMGPEIEFDGDMYIAVTGADMAPQVNGRPVEMYRTLPVHAGDLLSFGGLRSGLRGYIGFSRAMKESGLAEGEAAEAAAEGIPERNCRISRVLGSCSTDLRLGIGGLAGNALAAGDEIEFEEAEAAGSAIDFIERHIDVSKWSMLKDRYTETGEGESVREIRVVLGPQDDQFSEKGLETFSSSVYTVTGDSDRMGIRLDGQVIEHINEDKGNIISDGIYFGAIQVPASGKPIVMMSDRQTVGGYAKIAGVSTVDIPAMAQMMPGTKLKFKVISQQEAQRLLKHQRAFIRNLYGITDRQREGRNYQCRILNINLGDCNYEVEVERIR